MIRPQELDCGWGTADAFVRMYVCMYVSLTVCCSIIHPLSAVGNRHRFMACDCAMSGFIRTMEGKLTRATKGHFCLYLISMKTHQSGADGEEEERERNGGVVGRFSLRDRDGPLLFLIFISLEPKLPAGRTPAPLPINMKLLRENESLLIRANVSSAIQMHRPLADK